MFRPSVLVAALVSLTALPAQNKVDFAAQIVPILVQRCIQCHGPDKDKGDLRLDQRALAFPKGDEEYWVILAGKPGDSELLTRITLPDGDEDIMPEKGEPLSKTQQELFRRWIVEGAEWPENGDKAIVDAIAAAVISKITFDLPAVKHADKQAIERAMAILRSKGAVVQRVAEDTEAVDVNMSLLGDKAGDAELALLEPLAPVLVWLNISRTAITDAGAVHLAKLSQLRRLHAANTKLGDRAAEAVAGLEQLEFLNLYGTAITDDALPHLQGMPKLRKLHAWQTKVTPAGVKAIQDHLAKFEVDIGDYAEERMAAAAKDIAEREARNKPINETCPVLDKPINKDQVLEHEGRRIAFCCKNCLAKFKKDPAKYADKLPAKEAKK